jgi:DNA-binding transcriptional LysR family regulator
MFNIHPMDLSQFDLNLLPVLRALLEEESVTRAARRLRLSQSATSAALARLRKTLGDDLLARSGRGLALTPRARALRQFLPATLDAMRAQLLQVQQAQNPEVERLIRMRMPDFLAASLLPRLQPLLQLHGPCKIAVTQPVPDLPLAEFERGELDVLIASRVPLPPGLLTRTLYQERFVCLLNNRHPALREWGMTGYLEAEHVLISPRGGSFVGAVDEALSKLGHRRNVRLSMAAASSIPSVLRDTPMIAAVPETFARQVAPAWDLEIRELPFVVPGYAVQMIWHASTSKSKLHQSLRAAIVTCTKRSAV